MRIAFIWTGLTSYMADSWRQLAAEPDVELRVWIDIGGVSSRSVAFDGDSVMRGLDWKAVDGDASEIRETLRSVGEDLAEWKPDVIFAVGWHSRVCRAVVKDARLKNVPKICCLDMPWRWKLRCLVAPLVLGRFLRNYRAVFVPGQVCARYAKWLGFTRIYKGLFAIDTTKFNQPHPSSLIPHPYFLYLGRNSSEKRLDDIRAAHRIYRERGGTYELRMYGKGLEGGFVRPEDVPGLMRGAASFVLASDFDPWPLVLLEAMSAGCPVIASDLCTNRPELGKNWNVFKTGDIEALATRMKEVEEAPQKEDARRENLKLAQQYDCRRWVGRVRQIVEETRKSASASEAPGICWRTKAAP